MYGSLRTGHVTSGVGLVGAVQRDEPEQLQDILISRRKTYGYDDLAKALLYAAERGHEQCLIILLNHNVPPDIHDAIGSSAIHFAAKRGHHNILRLLIDARANVNKTNYRVRATALHWAATNDHEECVDILLASGVTVDAQTSNGRTPLMLAARTGNPDIVQSLLDAGANVNKCDYDRCSSLHLAAEEGHESTAQMLISAGAVVNARMKSGDTPLLTAVKRGQDSMVRYLLQLPDIMPTPSSHGLSALHWAAQHGHTACLEAILPYYSHPNVQTEATYYGPHFVVHAGVTPLMLSCGCGHVGASELLLRHGANTSLADVEGMVPLFYAIKRDHGDSVAALLAAGADPDQEQQEVDDDDPELTDTRPDSPIFPDAEEISGHALTPLFMCIERNSPYSLLALLAGGCELTKVYMAGHGQLVGPLEYCLYKGRAEMCLMLLSVGHIFNLSLTSLVQHALALMLQQDESSFTQIMALLSAPPLLAQQARWRVMRSISSLQAVDSLPVPQPIKNYIRLCDVREFIKPAKDDEG